MNKEVKEYIEKQKSPQKEIIKKVRKILLKTLKDPDEKTGWGVIIYKKSKFYLAGLKDKVNLGFAIKGLTKEEIKNFEGTGKTMNSKCLINTFKERYLTLPLLELYIT